MSATLLRAGSSTDLGRRQVNQDRVHVDDQHGIYAVADGMGGHRGGATAAEMAVSALAETEVVTSDKLIAAVEQANSAIYQRSQSDPDLQGMGTTITAMALVNVDGEDRLAIANVGDSRAYRLRSGELELLTEDHNIVSELVRDGHLSATEARTHRQRSVLTRAVGVEPGVAVDVIEVLPSTGDRYLLCSDGLTGEVDSNQIAGILRRYVDPNEACRDLIRVALASGSKDNISAVIVDVHSDGDAALHASQGLTPDAVGSDEDTVVLSRTHAYEPQDVPVATPIAPPEPPNLVADAKQRTALSAPRRRVVTFRTLAFAFALAAIGGIAYWAITNAPADPDAPPLTVVATTVEVSTTAIETTQLVTAPTTLQPTTLQPSNVPVTTVAPPTTLGDTVIPEDGIVGDPVVVPPAAPGPTINSTVTTVR